MKLKPIYTLVLALAVAACSTQSGNESANEEAPEEVVEIPVGDVTYSTDSTNMNGYFAVPEGEGKKPGILVVHEWWGHNDYSRMRADMLAEMGYVALAVDMYGDGKQAAHPDQAGEFSMMVMSNFEEAKARFESALNTLKNHPDVDGEKIGAIGYCFGGSVVLTMANSGYDLDAVASFHGGLRLPVMPEAGSVKGRILVANGADDGFIPEQQINDFKAAMDAAGADYKFINYEGAVHSFTSKAADSIAAQFNMPIAYNAEADSASWAEMTELFSSTFK